MSDLKNQIIDHGIPLWCILTMKQSCQISHYSWSR